MTIEAPEVTTLRRYLGPCEWFGDCDRPATHYRRESGGSKVPTCAACEARIELLVGKR